MSSFDWTHDFCLGCDKQVDGTTYCSESCRLADFEKNSTISSVPSSPAFSPPHDWSSSRWTSTTSRYHLPPALQFTQRQAVNVSSSTLSPSTSHASLSSIKSISSNMTESSQTLSEKAAKELRAYTRSLESVRLQRRRSY